MLWSSTINSTLDSTECGWVIRTSEQVLNVAALPVQAHSNPLLEFPNHTSLELNIVSQLIHMMDDWVLQFQYSCWWFTVAPILQITPEKKVTRVQVWGMWRPREVCLEADDPVTKGFRQPLSGVSRSVGSGPILHEPLVLKLESPSPQGSLELLIKHFRSLIMSYGAMCAFLNLRTFRINRSNLCISSVRVLFDFPELPLFFKSLAFPQFLRYGGKILTLPG